MATISTSTRPRGFATRLRYALPAFLLLAGLLLAGCTIERNPLDTYTETGQDLGALAFKSIATYDSKVSFVGEDPAKRREAQSLVDRYSERITFKNNAMLRYDKSTRYGFTGSWSEADRIQADVENQTFYKDRAIVFDRSKVKSGGYYTYLIQSSPTHNCFVFRGTFGDTQKTSRVGSAGDEAISGGMCYPANSKSLDALEHEMTDLLARARYDDGAGNHTQSATPTPAVAAAPLPVKDIGTFVPCYSPRLDVLYRARACVPADKTIDAAELGRIGNRLAQQRGATASSDGVPFAPAPAGTIIYTGYNSYFRIVAADDMLVTTISRIGAIEHRLGLFTSYWIEAQYDARAVERIWPLAVGKETSYVLTRNSDSWQETIKVARTERVTVPAGTFETYVVERRSLGTGSNSFEGTRTYWYAPAVGYAVKFGIAVKSGIAQGDAPWEATKIVRPDAAS